MRQIQTEGYNVAKPKLRSVILFKKNNGINQQDL